MADSSGYSRTFGAEPSEPSPDAELPRGPDSPFDLEEQTPRRRSRFTVRNEARFATVEDSVAAVVSYALDGQTLPLPVAIRLMNLEKRAVVMDKVEDELTQKGVSKRMPEEAVRRLAAVGQAALDIVHADYMRS